MFNISAIIITLNEEKNIERCLKSIINITDDIIVVDSYSTDKTEEICNKYNVRFIKSEWKGYSETKNFANSFAKYDWILSLDADEALSDKLKNSILNLNFNASTRYDVFSFNRLTNYCGKWIKHSGWNPDIKIRLWKKGTGSWCGEIHEKIIFNDTPKICLLKGDLYHYTYYTINEHRERINKYTNISAQSNFIKRKKTNTLQIYISPVLKFIKDYFLKLGFLDGYYGFIICKLSAYATYLKYFKLKQKYIQEKNANKN